MPKFKKVVNEQKPEEQKQSNAPNSCAGQTGGMSCHKSAVASAVMLRIKGNIREADIIAEWVGYAKPGRQSGL